MTGLQAVQGRREQSVGAGTGRHTGPLPWALRITRIAMWTLLALYCLLLVVHGSRFEPLVDGVLDVVTQLLPAAVCWLSVLVAVEYRAPAIWLAVGVTGFSLGNIVLISSLASGTALPVPSLADAGYLLFYPSALIALVLSVRRSRAARTGVRLDGALAGLASSALVALVLGPVFTTEGDLDFGNVVSLAYPVLDLVLIGSVASAASLSRSGHESGLAPLFAGLLVFLTGDVVYDVRIAHNAYAVGTLLDASWGAGLAVMTLWLTRRPTARGRSAVADSVTLVVPAASTVLAVAVLVVVSTHQTAGPALVLAVAALLAAAARIQFAFVQQRRALMYRQEARSDELTGLPNRRDLSEQLQRSRPGAPAALLLVDIDDLDEVNIALGRHLGDRFIVEIAQRLSNAVPPGAQLSRTGGSEFALLLPGSGHNDAQQCAEGVHTALEAPVSLDHWQVSGTATVGIAVADAAGTDVNLLLPRAERALRRGNRSRTPVTTHAPSDDIEGVQRLQITQELRSAISAGQLRLHFQPEIGIPGRQLLGLEALVRWAHPQRGLLAPGEFLPIAESAGLMPAITDWVLGAALDQAAEWAREGHPHSVAVNLSADALIDESLPERISSALQQRHIPAERLEVEITEDQLIRDRNRAARVLAQIRSIGVRVALDDFGTGYSSLAYLRDLPLDTIKLDRSFIQPMTEDSRAAAVVATAITLAHRLDLRIVAEGVENEATLNELVACACDAAQGNFLHPAAPAKSFADLKS